MADSVHVLVVEDDPDVAEHLRLVLVKKAGMRVELAADIEVASDILRPLRDRRAAHRYRTPGMLRTRVGHPRETR